MYTGKINEIFKTLAQQPRCSERLSNVERSYGKSAQSSLRAIERMPSDLIDDELLG